MSWEPIVNQLEHILGTRLRYRTISVQEWKACSNLPEENGEGTSIVLDHSVLFPLQKLGNQIEALEIDEGMVTVSERKLVELTLNSYRAQQKRSSARIGDERRAEQIGQWIRTQIETGNVTEMPDTLAVQSSFYTSKIPILLYGEYPDTKRVSHSELKRLLESFFDEEVMLIPMLDKEWLILGPETLLSASGSTRENEEEEPIEESLAAICSGLHDMLTSEWIGENHLAITYPMIPAKTLVSTVMLLKETISLGRIYHVSDNLHFPWMLHLERLLHGIPDYQKQQFMEQALKRVDPFLEPETLSTVESFFELNCSVSETAKMLYIHRNTLLYRLDKLKQETGLDVRSFRDAVLVRIILLLYKVTKRK